jgi:hypothetical protein
MHARQHPTKSTQPGLRKESRTQDTSASKIQAKSFCPQSLYMLQRLYDCMMHVGTPASILASTRLVHRLMLSLESLIAANLLSKSLQLI